MSVDQRAARSDALNALKVNAALAPAGQVFKIRDVIGEQLWEPLERTTRHDVGRHVRANLDHYGLVVAGYAGRILLYRRSAV